MNKFNITHFKSCGDSPWWKHLMIDMFNMDVEIDKEATVMIYEPNISQELGNQGIEIVKNGDVVSMIPQDSFTIISTVQEPISAECDFFYHENVNVPEVLAKKTNNRNLCYVSGDFYVDEFNTTSIKTFFVPGWNHLFWTEDDSIIDVTVRSCEHTFLSFNRIHKPHRMYFMVRMKELGMLDDNLLSCASNIDGETFEQHFNWISNDKKQYGSVYDPHDFIDLKRLVPIARELQTELPFVLDVSNFQENGCFEQDSLLSSVPFYQSSFMSVVTESNAVGPGCYISEAIFRPIIFQQPFLIVGQPRTLEVLRHWGFDTFDDIFDNSYDLEPDMFKRTEMVIDQIKLYHDKTPNELRKITLEIADRLVYNKKRYFSDEFKEITKSYFENLIEWINENNNTNRR